MEKKAEHRGLGRGLSALMADVALDQSRSQTVAQRRGDVLIAIEKIVPNPDQPRRSFEPEAMKDLADSLEKKGVIQPLIVRQIGGDDKYEIVAGERRWRAAQMANLHELPVIVRQFSDAEVLEIAIIENIQRAELNAIEEAFAYRQLMQRFGHTQEKIAEALSKSRSHIANLLRLLTLPEDVQTFVKQGKMSSGHARALITSGDPSALARQVIARGLSVRETEQLVRKVAAAPHNKRVAKGNKVKDADTKSLEMDLSANLKMNVQIDHAPGGPGGKITIAYHSLDELDLLCRVLSQIPRDGTV